MLVSTGRFLCAAAGRQPAACTNASPPGHCSGNPLLSSPPPCLPPGLSEAGFQFLLSDTYHQLWLLLRQYLDSMEASSSE